MNGPSQLRSRVGGMPNSGCIPNGALPDAKSKKRSKVIGPVRTSLSRVRQTRFSLPVSCGSLTIHTRTHTLQTICWVRSTRQWATAPDGRLRLTVVSFSLSTQLGQVVRGQISVPGFGHQKSSPLRADVLF